MKDVRLLGAVVFAVLLIAGCGTAGGDGNEEQPGTEDVAEQDAAVPEEDAEEPGDDAVEPGEDVVDPDEDVVDPEEVECIPDCEGKACSDQDGCGAECGCGEGLTCCDDGECKEECEACTPVTVPEEYVGAKTCKGCHGGMHPEVVENWENSGHSFKLNPVVDGQPPVYPEFVGAWYDAADFELLPGLGITWADVAYVIGGYGWKARFIGHDGYIITGDEATPGVQYNLETEGWASYHTGEQKAYNCGSCHTTGWVAADPDCPPNADMPGFQGVYVDPQVSCEACHGAGKEHAQAPSAANIGDPKESCGDCHVRGDDMEKIPAKGGLIRHHEQYQEVLASPHKAFSCDACHDAHASSKYDADAPGEGVRTACTTCHGDVKVAPPHDQAANCVDCHMAKIVKSATSSTFGEGDGALTYGDIAGHLFAVSIDPEATLTFKDADDAEWASPEVPVIYACKKCHPGKTIEEAVQGGAAIHAE